MFPGGPNPTQVQFVPPGKAFNPPLPLVLIHDGGGTTFSYFILGSLARDVWAVHNPNYFEGLPFKGGMDEMARRYIDLIAGELTGPIMLGGWSLGGFLSLTMARIIAADPAAYPISVAGLLIIDSPYHIARSKVTAPTSKADLAGLPPLVQTSFDNCDDMLQHWDLPSWNPANGGNTKFILANKPFTLQPGEVLRKTAQDDPNDNQWQTMKLKPYEEDALPRTSETAPSGPPPGVLIRCTKRAKPKSTPGGEDAHLCLVDLFRDEKLLGWEGRHPEFFKAVIDVDTDHYNLFDRTNTKELEKVTATLAKGLQVLDAVHMETKKGAVGF